MALLANYSMHYYGSPLLSADYYGRFCEKIGPLIGADTNERIEFCNKMARATDLVSANGGTESSPCPTPPSIPRRDRASQCIWCWPSKARPRRGRSRRPAAP